MGVMVQLNVKLRRHMKRVITIVLMSIFMPIALSANVTCPIEVTIGNGSCSVTEQDCTISTGTTCNYYDSGYGQWMTGCEIGNSGNCVAGIVIGRSGLRPPNGRVSSTSDTSDSSEKSEILESPAALE